jgi:two-component system nitrogen regulation sensor histidine kinase NtrY
LNAFPGNLIRKNVYLLLAAIALFIFVWLSNKYLVRSTSARYYANAIENSIQKKEKDFQKLVADTALIKSLIDQSYSEEVLESIIKEKRGYGLYIYDNVNAIDSHLVFWNTQEVTPPFILLEETDASHLVKLENGRYVSTSKSIVLNGKTKYSVEALIPVITEYYVQLENFRRQFADHPGAERIVDISFESTDFPVKSSFGNTLFYLREIPGDRRTNWWSLILTITGAFLLFIYVHQEASYISEHYGLWRGVAFMALVLLLIRLTSYYYPDFLNLRQFGLFDPGIYSSSFVLSSLGDLLINGLLFSWLMLFINRRISGFHFHPIRPVWLNWLVVVVLLAALVGFTFIFADILQTLVSDGQISFNVTNIENLSRYSFVGFLILAILALSYFFLAQILLTISGKLMRSRFYMTLIISAFIGLTILTFVNNTAVVELNLYVLLWLMVFLLMMQQQLFSGLRFRLNVSEVLFWLFVFSFSMAAVIIFENRKIEADQRKRFAEKLALRADPSNEKLISISLAYLDNDFLYPNFQRFRDPVQNDRIKDSIINKNFLPYLNRYETRIYTFDERGTPLYNAEPVSYDTLNTIFSLQSKTTGTPDLRYFEKSYDKFSFICRKEVRAPDSTIAGFFFVLSDPKKYKSDALVPELFQQSRDPVPDYSQAYSYAIYNDRKLATYYNDFPFPTLLDQSQVPKQEVVQSKYRNYDVLTIKGTGDNVVIVAKKNDSFIEAITLFSWLFTSFIMLLAFYRLTSLLLRSRTQSGAIRQYWQMSIRSQIHSTIIMVSLLSFLVIGAATIFFFINRYDRDSSDRLTRSSQIMSREIRSRFSRTTAEMLIYDDSLKNELLRLMTEIADIHSADVNLYDTAGRLKVTSNPPVYDKGVLSTLMNPMAYYQLHKMRAIQYVTEEKIGQVDFKSIYSPVRDDDGNAYVYLNIPSFRKQGELTQEISNFLVTIINLNAFIFLVAGAIALFITNRITSSFTIIGQKMRDINLNKINQEIEWKRKDEIGELVKEYNKMVRKLDESADALAKSEREGAWRQMARQVAHEIKNPLTPMKLSIQYLQKAIDNNSPNVKEMTGSVARTLIEQIDHLSKIASDFSQFANIGNPRNEVFDLHDLLNSLSSLYEATENHEFEWTPVNQKVMVFADKTQLNRLFTNLLQNAVEACATREKVHIRMNEILNGEYITVSITDNGEGIPEQTRSKIFTPNFTTKSSGTGLGLAMSKSIAEQAHGEIWFITREGEGTTFFVKLPLLRQFSN